MEGFDNFSVFIDKKDTPFITLRSTTITFSVVAIELLEYSRYVHMLVDMTNKKIAFKQCDNDKAAIPFYIKEKNEKQLLVRLSGKDKIDTIMNLAGINDCGKGIRFYGYFDDKNKALIFDMKQYNKES